MGFTSVVDFEFKMSNLHNSTKDSVSVQRSITQQAAFRFISTRIDLFSIGLNKLRGVRVSGRVWSTDVGSDTFKAGH